MSRPTPALSIDEILERTNLGAKRKLELLGLERRYRAGEVQGDVLADFEARPKDDLWRQAVAGVLDGIRSATLARMDAMPSGNPVRLDVITGAPGSGKTVVRNALDVHRERPAVYLCVDAVKAAFKQAALQQPILAGDPRLHEDGLIHRLCAMVSWDLYNLSQQRQIDVVLEMLGVQAEPDLALLKNAIERGARTTLHHVATRTSVALDRAIARYFQTGEPDSGRHVPLLAMAGMQVDALNAFNTMANRILDERWGCSVRLYDTSDRSLLPAWRYDPGKPNRPLPDLSALFDLKAGKGLWHTGPNPTADLALFASTPSGWAVAMVERGKPPFQGRWALPGGFQITDAQRGRPFEPGAERAEDAARREFAEETLAAVPTHTVLVEVGAYDDRMRDPRNRDDAWVASTLFAGQVEVPLALHGSDDAAAARWVLLRDIDAGSVRLAFDHGVLIADARRALGLNDTPPLSAQRRPAP